MNLVNYINPGWGRKTEVSDNKFVFSNCKKHCSMGWEFYSLNIRWQKDKFSQAHFEKISKTL